MTVWARGNGSRRPVIRSAYGNRGARWLAAGALLLARGSISSNGTSKRRHEAGELGHPATSAVECQTQAMSTVLNEWRAMPIPPRWTATGASVLGTLGGIAGLIIGLDVHPPTAWAAIVELGLPAALVGAVVGIVIDLMVMVSRRLRRRSG